MARLSPSSLNGERTGVRGGNVKAFWRVMKREELTIPHPQSLSPLKGEGSPRATSQETWAIRHAQQKVVYGDERNGSHRPSTRGRGQRHSRSGRKRADHRETVQDHRCHFH